MSFKEPSTGIYGNDYVAELQKQGLPVAEINNRVITRDIEMTTEVDDVRYVVMALDARTGKVDVAAGRASGQAPGGRHRKNTYASETPATDGERVYASFGGNVGLFCYSMDGKLLWKQHVEAAADLSRLRHRVVSGRARTGACISCTTREGESSLTALDAKTGDGRVDVEPRTAFEARQKSGWSTPFIWQNGARTEIVTIGKSDGHELRLDGKELWRLGGMTQATPTPVAGGGLLFVGSGSQGEANRPMFAVKPGATGDISLKAGETSGARSSPGSSRACRATPARRCSTAAGCMSINDNGVMQVYDAATGKEVYKARVGGVGNTFSSSPFASNGRIFSSARTATRSSSTPATSTSRLAKNSLGEMSLATPAATRRASSSARRRSCIASDATRISMIAHDPAGGPAPRSSARSSAA